MLLNARRAVIGILGAGAVTGATLLAGAPSAFAEPVPPPNCTAADLAGVQSGVSAATSAYLFTHPPVNDFFTSLHGLPHDQMEQKVNEYFDANPQTGAELKNIRKPLQDIRIRCGDTDGDGDVDIL
ncbi:heme-binding protein [Mycolicibacterium bacteremicum]|uniref:Hemophore-related protein n=1 Tax=Mycolicibacterium bacteremicum TaxID=564198 RepID=A0A1W9YTF3_MYCBA|nr:heme-binding protein [Mycolicibacterium bacteremicum]MCV7432939.1 heme-binding protein [Mycolicibacterium bacteremicum]ORA03279.1 hemophore-related protein [Mycolicibacterium bacteremicum]